MAAVSICDGMSAVWWKLPACPLTDHLEIGILQAYPGWRGPHAVRSAEKARVHHAARQRGGMAACGARAARRAGAADLGVERGHLGSYVRTRSGPARLPR